MGDNKNTGITPDYEQDNGSGITPDHEQDDDGTGITPENEGSWITPEKDENDEGLWITPENVLQQEFEMWGRFKEKEKKVWSSVACITTDYAMQNIMLQMGLRLMTINGFNIRKIRYYIMKCHSCFRTTQNMSKQFCPFCGNLTLLKCSLFVKEDGSVFYRYPKWKMYNYRGENRPIPPRKGGRNNNDPILREPDAGWRPWRANSDSVRRKSMARKKTKDSYLTDKEFATKRVGIRRA